MRRLLLCTDLDRTLLPNGEHPESPEARRLFAGLAARDQVTLVYATGRNLGLTVQAIAEFALPHPAAILADVGATILLPDGPIWRSWTAWERHIDREWRQLGPREIDALLQGLPEIRPQEEEKQGRHKISCYVSLEADREALGREITRRLGRWGVKATLVFSIDEPAATGLLDILPAGAGKLKALRFFLEGFGFRREEVIFAGDSGNDLEVLESDLAAVLVANAHPGLRRQLAARPSPTLYLAQGGYLAMNGNYAAGILEGVAHFRPELNGWLRQEINDPGIC